LAQSKKTRAYDPKLVEHIKRQIALNHYIQEVIEPHHNQWDMKGSNIIRFRAEGAGSDKRRRAPPNITAAMKYYKCHHISLKKTRLLFSDCNLTD